MEEVEVEEPGAVERVAEAASELGLGTGSGAGGWMRLGGPLQGGDEVGIEGEMTAREEAGGLDGPEDEDGRAEWHGPGGPGGKLRNDRRRPIQRSTTQRSQTRSRSRKAIRELRSEAVTSVLDERGSVRRPYRSCMAMLKGWTLGSSEGRPR